MIAVLQQCATPTALVMLNDPHNSASFISQNVSVLQHYVPSCLGFISARSGWKLLGYDRLKWFFFQLRRLFPYDFNVPKHFSVQIIFEIYFSFSLFLNLPRV